MNQPYKTAHNLSSLQLPIPRVRHGFLAQKFQMVKHSKRRLLKRLKQVEHAEPGIDMHTWSRLFQHHLNIDKYHFTTECVYP
jgi:hypothetical protein